MNMVNKIKQWLRQCRKQGPLITTGTWNLGEGCALIPTHGAAFALRLGGLKGQTLHLYPLPADAHANREENPMLLVEPERFFSSLGGFLLMEPGMHLVIGSHDDEQRRSFQFPPAVASRHLLLEHCGPHLFVQDLKTDSGSHLAVLAGEEMAHHLPDWQLSQLAQITRLFGGPLTLLPPAAALDRLQKAHQTLRDTWKAAPNQAAPAIIHLPPHTIPILVGDLHARLGNLLTLLTLGGCLNALQTGRATLLFLGDAVHPDEGSHPAEMTGSLLMMDVIFSLMHHFPGRVVYIRGNHDGCEEEIYKGGISQGLAWQKAMMKVRGEAYWQGMLGFYEDLPYIALHPDVVACHASPFVVKVDQKILANLRNYPGLLRQLIWNRIRQPHRPGGYTAKDIRLFLQALGMPSKTPLVVGHTPMDNQHTLWMNAGGITGHHILYGAHDQRMGWITFLEGALVAQEYPVRY